LARAVGVSPVVVSLWRTGARQVPAERCPAIEKATGGLVRCEELRPDVEWSVLRNTPELATLPANQVQVDIGMKIILTYLASLPAQERDAFAQRCGTTVGYLRKAVSAGQRLGESLCMHIERESGGAITCEDLRTDVPWEVLRGTELAQATTIQAQAATETVAKQAA